MTQENENREEDILPDSSNSGKVIRGLLQVGGAIPLAGGVLSAIAGAWSEHDQEKINRIIEDYLMRIKDESREQKKTLAEVIARIDANDEAVRKRFESEEYQSILKKTFRNWSGIDSEEKRVLIRNLLINAASSAVSSDDVVHLFNDWIRTYSLLHFTVIGAIYNTNGISRGAIWEKIGKERVREDSAEADVYKLLFRDLSTGGIIRQHREVDRFGNFIVNKPAVARPKGSGPKPAVSAFDREEPYELTSLGKQFVHYAMTEVTQKLGFNKAEPAKEDA